LGKCPLGRPGSDSMKMDVKEVRFGGCGFIELDLNVQ
jgi:hypothetical protein